MNMRAGIVVVIVAGSCSGGSGDPSTYVVNGEPKAGYAWSGPGGFCCDLSMNENVGWQVVFTTSPACPSNKSDDAILMFLSPSTTPFPNTQLPDLPTNVVPIETIGGYGVTHTMAYLNGSDYSAISGSVTVTVFRTDEVAGSFTAMARSFKGDMFPIEGTFNARSCNQIPAGI